MNEILRPALYGAEHPLAIVQVAGADRARSSGRYPRQAPWLLPPRMLLSFAWFFSLASLALSACAGIVCARV